MLFGVIAIICTALVLGWIALSFICFPAKTKRYFSDRPTLLINKNPIIQAILTDESPTQLRTRAYGIYVLALLSLILWGAFSKGGIMRDLIN